MFVRLNPGARILPPTVVTGDRWVAEDLRRKRRFTIQRPLAAVLVAAAVPQDPDELAKQLAELDPAVAAGDWQRRVTALLDRGLLVSSDPADDWREELTAAWTQANWREAAEYHLLAFDYPCIDYSEASAMGIDRSRMRDYQAIEPDANRYKLDYAANPGEELPAPTAEIATGTAYRHWNGETPAAPATAEALAAVLSLTFGVLQERTPVTESAPLLRRTSPSGGGRNPSEGYLFVRSVPGYRPGWYHVTLKPFSLRLVSTDVPASLTGLFPDFPADPAAVVLVTSVFERNMYRYREPRTYRTVHMDAGHLLGTARLVAESIGLRAIAGDAGDALALENQLGLDGMAEGYLGGLALYDGNAPAAIPATIAPTPATEPAIAQPLDTWPALVRIRPTTDEPGIEVADVVSGRTHRFNPAELAADLLAGAVPALPTTTADDVRRAQLLPGLQHWQHRGWHPSDQSYVASRRPATVIPEPATPTAAAPRPGPGIELPAPAHAAKHSIARLLVNRRTGRAYIRRPAPAEVLSGLLWHGLSEFRTGTSSRAAADWDPSVWEVCLCVHNVEGVERGAYRYDPQTHRLHLVQADDLRPRMATILQGMRSPSSAGWTLGLVADFERQQQVRPSESGLRSLYTQSGVIAQDLIVLGSAYDLSTLVTPAQQDSAYLELHGLHPRQYGPIYTLTMGLSRGLDGVYPDEAE
ncbi:hypothetical protein HPO96_22445 [Kribbella sandramycini]|uniref:SagB-type dehydrogenase family enzyme n=1 Tax=Kribbella sandramycini TaxID=60450 RepID=A0A7Y4L2B6_9ACTN|nr:hypothetical protein [Kribbella sandramycini]MBB6566326.1 SagB-type dehydrogenase family enzyme [Kribbella sandramycini]NOL43012.1 hypothetical protein [Kribbella sandramycini]